jgi:hypothetical protein
MILSVLKLTYSQCFRIESGIHKQARNSLEKTSKGKFATLFGNQIQKKRDNEVFANLINTTPMEVGLLEDCLFI